MSPIPRRRRRVSDRPAADGDDDLLTRLRAGDEDAFVALVERHHDAMLRLARTFVHSDAVAEEVVQETWVAALRGLDGFEERSSLRTWLLAILANRARTIAAREVRDVPVDDSGPAVEASRFDAGGMWTDPPEPWADAVVNRLSATALADTIEAALAAMPSRQRAVVTLRDVEELRSDEVCEVLGITPANERVLLHRGRSRLRQALEDAVTDR